jgi:RNA polymerase sigma-70 factor (ECF subfamily)
MTEKKAIARLKDGDIGGLEWLVRAHQTKALRTAFLIVHDLKLAEDIVQTAFIKVYERIQQFDSRRPFAPWFYKVVFNDAIKAVRKQKDTVSLETDDPKSTTTSDWLSTDLSLPEEQYEQFETSEELWLIRQQLPPEQRAVLVLLYYAGLTRVEIADDLQIPQGTVRWRLHAALKRLRGLINISKDRTIKSLSFNHGSHVKEREK